MTIRESYTHWLKNAEKDLLAEELKNIENDDAAIEDAFYTDLAFGTGGLRGVIGAGTNRMNVYTVARASQGLAEYISAHFEKGKRRIAISRDSRLKSDLFAAVSAAVFSANGIRVLIYDEIMPTPCLSYAVRALKCAAGVMITASHNPSKYNGYKVYGPDGCQITSSAAKEILSFIENTDPFHDIRTCPFPLHSLKENGLKISPELTDLFPGTSCSEPGTISYIPDDIYSSFIAEVKKQSVLYPGDTIDRNVAIVYSPLNGTGRYPVSRILAESGYTNVMLVPEQTEPDGNFPTCPFPNPEIREAMELGIRYAEEKNADLLLATDPDCDRVGIAVRDEKKGFTLLSGNETGLLLLDYILFQRSTHGTLPADPLMVKTIVTTDMGQRIADRFGVRTVNVLTGFKYIGEQIGMLENIGQENRYVFGFEESYGYLSGTYVRDKDAVNAAFLICEMFSFYKARGISLLERLNALYAEYGYCLNTLHSFQFEGSSGFRKMQEIMSLFRSESGAPSVLGTKTVISVSDYKNGLDGLPAADVLKFYLEDNCSVVVRPSGTEPKLKLYISVSAPTRTSAAELEQQIKNDLEKRLH